MGVSADQPWLDMAYKLVQQNGRPVLKLSSGKSYYPGPKQIFRLQDGGGKLKKAGSPATRRSRRRAAARKSNGRRKTPGAYPSLNDIRARFLAEFERLDEKVKAIRDAAAYPVELSTGLMRLNEETSRRITQAEI
jgi:nicotinate phosphoribosyltransferase